MGREILFRAFDGELNLISKPFTLGQVLNFGDKHIMSLKESHSIMQYTGLLDKNNTKIFEGDILRKFETDYDSEIYHDWEEGGYEGDPPRKIVIDECCLDRFGFWLKNESFGYEGEDIQQPEYWEVIGNIHQNQELLNK